MSSLILGECILCSGTVCRLEPEETIRCREDGRGMVKTMGGLAGSGNAETGAECIMAPKCWDFNT